MLLISKPSARPRTPYLTRMPRTGKTYAVVNGVGKTDSSHAATESDGAAAKLPRCNTKVYAAYRMTSILDKHGVNKCLITSGKPDRSVSCEINFGVSAAFDVHRRTCDLLVKRDMAESISKPDPGVSVRANAERQRRRYPREFLGSGISSSILGVPSVCWCTTPKDVVDQPHGMMDV